MKNIILILCMLFLFSCGAVKNMSKNVSKSKIDSSYSNFTDSSLVTSNNGIKDSTGVSNWQKETIIEYYSDWDNSLNDSSSFIIEKGSDTLFVPKSSSIKKIIIREKGKDSTRLIISNKIEGNSKVSKVENGETKKVNTNILIDKVVTKKPIWPYLLLIFTLLSAIAYLYYKKINPLSLIKSIFK